jgi:preprotein translocase subunit YajC
VFYIELAVLGLLLWFFMVRPASKRNKQLRQDQAQASVGSEVMLTSGIFGRVAAIDEDAARISIEIAPGVTIEVARVAIAMVIPDKTEDEVDETASTDAPAEAVESD